MDKLFNQNRHVVQSLCNIIQPVLGAELMVVDQSLIAVAGTGPYHKNVGSRRPRDSYVDVTLKSGEGFSIGTAGQTEQCLRCEIRSSCPYTSVISCPLLYQNEVVGLIGFLGYDRRQQATMQKKSLFLSKMAEKIGAYLVDNFSGNALSYNDFIASRAMEEIVNTLDEGVIITDCNDRIVNVNQCAEETLRVRHTECLGRGIELFSDALDVIGAGRTGGGVGITGKAGIVARSNSISYDERPVGKVLVLRSGKRKTGSHCVYHFRGPDLGPELVGSSGPFTKLKEIIGKVAANDSRILICGETGTGKELVARLVHLRSPRCRGPFVALNCGAIPETLIESELFGYAKGSFTDARREGKKGKFELANHGTIFLDEIGNLSFAGQAKILRILDNNVLEKIGGSAPIELDVRAICATNKNLPEMVANGRFMEDLYYRLNVVQIEVPPLRERRTDIPLLLEHFLREHNQRLGARLKGFDRATLRYLIHYPWPGNVRELKNVTEYACNLKSSGLAGLQDLPPYMSPLKDGGESLPECIDTEKIMVEQAIRLFGRSTASKKEAARYLGISLSTLYRRLNRQADADKAR